MTTDSPTPTDETASTGERQSSDDRPTDAPETMSKKTPEDGIAPVDDYREAIDDVLETCREKFDELLDEVSLEFSDDDGASDAVSDEPTTTANGDRREP